MSENNRSRLRIMILTALMTAITTVSTLFIRIPTPTKGYINVGDIAVNISAWILGPFYGAVAGGIGSALADLISGYAVYVPATLVIKGIMAAAAFIAYNVLSKNLPSLSSRIAAAVVSEIIMITGYAIFAAVLHGSPAAALLSMSGNIVQGTAGVVLSVMFYEALVKRIPAEKFIFNRK